MDAKLLLFDLDGTVYLDGVLFPGVQELFKRLADSKLEYCFLTNNSSIAPEDYYEKLSRLGLPLTMRNVVTSAHAACLMLKSLNIGPEIYMLGTAKFRNFMENNGFVHSFEDAKALLIAFDKEITYQKLHEATRLVLKGVPVYATHPDPVCPPDYPDAGMLIEYLKAVKPGTYISSIAGKPHKWLAKMLEQRFAVKPGEMVMVGDRLNTDMRFAQNFGMRSILTLNGVKMPDLGDIKPTLILEHTAQLANEFWPEKLGWC